MSVVPSIATAEHLLYDEDVDHATRFGGAEGEDRIQMCVQNYGKKDSSFQHTLHTYNVIHYMLATIKTIRSMTAKIFLGISRTASDPL